MKISLVIAVSDGEVEKLSGCISSVEKLVDEIVVFDLRSSKNSPLPEEKAFKIVNHAPVIYIEPIRNQMVETATGDWILILDPDERLTHKLLLKLEQVAKESVADAVNIPRKNIFFGIWVKHSNWWPDKHVRFFKRGMVRWSHDIHAYPEVSGKVLDLSFREELAIEHYGYSSVAEFINRQNRYSEVEAENRTRKGEKATIITLFWLPAREFLARYIKHLGFLDGVYGFILVYLMMVYKIMVWVKIWEKEK